MAKALELTPQLIDHVVKAFDAGSAHEIFKLNGWTWCRDGKSIIPTPSDLTESVRKWFTYMQEEELDILRTGHMFYFRDKTHIFVIVEAEVCSVVVDKNAW
jgi:hypothetical protein